MSSLGSSRSESASYRSFNKNNNKYIHMNPLAIYSSIVFPSAVVNIIKESKQIYLLHLLIYQDTVYTASFYAIMITFIELITHTLAEAHSQMSKKILQAFVLNHQAFVADIYLLYNFFTLLFMQLLLSCICGGLYNYILPGLSRNSDIKKYFIYYLISVFSSPITNSMSIYIENIMDISRESIKSYVIKINDALLTMVAFSIFLISKPSTFSPQNVYTILAILQSLVYIISYMHPFLMLSARKNNKIPIRLNIRNFKPFRGILFAKMLYYSEYINALLVVVYTQQDYNETIYYPNIAVYIFILIKQLTKLGKSLQFATKRFLEAYFESNLVGNHYNRIYEILTKGIAIYVTLNLVIVAAVYIIAIPVAKLIFARNKFSDDEYDVVLYLVDKVKLSALCIFFNILTPFNQAMAYIFDNKFTLYNKLCCIVVELLINVGLIIFQIIEKNAYLYINFYVVFQCISGGINMMFFIVMVVKFSKKYKLEYSSYCPQIEQTKKQKTKKTESIDELAQTIADITKNLAENNSFKSENNAVESAFNNLLDGLGELENSENNDTIYGSDQQTNFVNPRISRKSKIRAKQVDINDSFALQKTSDV